MQQTTRRRGLTLTGSIAGALFLLMTAVPSFAQSPSDPTGMTTRSDIADYLGQTYDEAPVAGGVAANGTWLEVFVSPQGDSWTLVVTRPDGTSQVVAAGESWIQLLKAEGDGI